MRLFAAQFDQKRISWLVLEEDSRTKKPRASMLADLLQNFVVEASRECEGVSEWGTLLETGSAAVPGSGLDSYGLRKPHLRSALVHESSV